METQTVRVWFNLYCKAYGNVSAHYITGAMTLEALQASPEYKHPTPHQALAGRLVQKITRITEVVEQI